MNVLDLVREKGIDPKRVSTHKGGEYHSPCPGCGGENRFHVWPEQNSGEGSYWCRPGKGCGKTGDAIQFLRDFDGLSYNEARERLGKSSSQSPQYQTPKIPKQYIPADQGPIIQNTKPPDLWIEKATKLVGWAHEKLLPNSARMKYLRDRGIKRATVIKWKIGWNPGKDGKDLWRPRESWGLQTELKNNRKKRLWIPRGLIIPLIAGAGDQIHRVRIRTLAGKPPYYILPGSVMNTMMIGPDNHRAYVVVESELDAILLDQEIGDLAGIIALGSASTKPVSDTYRALHQSAVILVSLDFDAPGAKAWKWWKDHFPQSERWPVPLGKDPGEACHAGADLAEWVRLGLPLGWRIGQLFLGRKKGETEEGRKKPEVEHGEAVKELVAILASHPVAIHITPDRIRIRETRKWARENWETSKRLSDLVFLNEQVMDFLHAHPEQVVTGGNIL